MTWALAMIVVTAGSSACLGLAMSHHYAGERIGWRSRYRSPVEYVLAGATLVVFLAGAVPAARTVWGEWVAALTSFAALAIPPIIVVTVHNRHLKTQPQRPPSAVD